MISNPIKENADMKQHESRDDNCKGCNSRLSECTVPHKQNFTCPCVNCIVKMMCNVICHEYMEYFRIDKD